MYDPDMKTSQRFVPQELAIFPIPGCVSFPGTVVPLHVFEPRYRQMVKDCLKDQRLIAVTHTRRVISEARNAQQSIEQALNSNQATYEPTPIFGGGYLELKELLPDGRMMIEVHIENRFKLQALRQEIPYLIGQATLYEDQPSKHPSGHFEHLRRALHETIQETLRNQSPELMPRLQTLFDSEIPLADLTFTLFSMFRMQPEVMQTILESQDPLERAQHWMNLLKGQGTDQQSN